MTESKGLKEQSGSTMSRSRFIGATAAAAAAFTIVPRHVLGGPGYQAPSDKIVLACIGTGGQGLVNIRSFLRYSETHFVAVADVNQEMDYSEFYFGGTAGWEPAKELIEESYAEDMRSGIYRGCTAYTDYREMLEEEQDIEGVVVSTTDNIHAPASIAAIRRGLHVYCEKPLTITVQESRMVAEAARNAGVATQMGNSGQASEATRLLSEYVWDGAIGDVREVHIWSNRPMWPQGIDRPTETPRVPRTLDWDGWIGPAPMRPYHPAYLPFNWRGWRDFGTGALGDMGCHQFDPIFRALKLGHPTSIEASASKYMQEINQETYPRASIVYYKFPARDNLPPVDLTWYDGGLMPPRPEELEDDRQMTAEGELLIGDKGKILNGRLIPEERMAAYTVPEPTLPRSIGHHAEWLEAIRGVQAAGSNFDFAGLVTEVVLLGNAAISAGEKLNWDGQNLRVTNSESANQYITRSYREGWSL